MSSPNGNDLKSILVFLSPTGIVVAVVLILSGLTFLCSCKSPVDSTLVSDPDIVFTHQRDVTRSLQVAYIFGDITNRSDKDVVVIPWVGFTTSVDAEDFVHTNAGVLCDSLFFNTAGFPRWIAIGIKEKGILEAHETLSYLITSDPLSSLYDDSGLLFPKVWFEIRRGNHNRTLPRTLEKIQR
jgi:hypothetical protein